MPSLLMQHVAAIKTSTNRNRKEHTPTENKFNPKTPKITWMDDDNDNRRGYHDDDDVDVGDKMIVVESQHPT